MKILHHIRKENSGLMRAALELCHYEERLGHAVSIRQTHDDSLTYGEDIKPDIHVIHSQLHVNHWHDNIPKVMMMHGEPLSSVANGISMKAIVDLAPLVEAFICMREDEAAIWQTIKRTWTVPKGVDLEKYAPMDIPPDKKLSGAPAVLYCENWRGERNPLYLCAAMRLVANKYPDARLHLFNCRDKNLYKTFKALFDHNKWGTFIRTIDGPADDVVKLYNRCDIVASCLYPLFARTAVESLACGKPHVAPGYTVQGYPYGCDLHPESIADAIVSAWENRDTFDARDWAKQNHDAEIMAQRCIEIYERYLP